MTAGWFAVVVIAVAASFIAGVFWGVSVCHDDH